MSRVSTRLNRSPAAYGWLGVFVVVVGYDMWALRTEVETLSGFFWRHRDDRVTRFVGVGAWLGLTWHLLLGDKRVLPPSAHNYYLRIHPLWRANSSLKPRVMDVIVSTDVRIPSITEIVPV